jgi:geranylgeranyl diphosphate synthase type II
MMYLKEYLEERRMLVEEALEGYLPGEDAYPAQIHQAVRYSIFSGGKRLRPILAIAAAEAVGGDAGIVMHFACGIEMIHTYSLIHDDLPAMDNDEIRRGKPTSHKVFGEGMAILAGDAILTEAFGLMARESLKRGMDPAVALEIIAETASAAGLTGMISGQAMDILKQGLACSRDELEFIHHNKTAAMIAASVRAGARTAGASPSQLEALTEYGQSAGLAFQIMDDILDVKGGKDWGKIKGSDQRLGKATYPSVHGMEDSLKQASRLSEKARAAISDFDEKADPLRHISEYMVSRTY